MFNKNSAAVVVFKTMQNAYGYAKTMNVKNNLQPKVKRNKKKIFGDSSRVITRFHIPDSIDRIRKIIERIIDLPDAEAENLLGKIMFDYS